MRIDVYLTKNGLANSRTEAKAMVEAGFIYVSGKQIKKPSFDVDETVDNEIEVIGYIKKYVSRGGYKLECAINNFDFEITDRMAIDIGASSGGFTDCLLQNGAKHVIALDSGTAQLADRLRSDERITVMENYNARYLKREDFPYIPNLAVMDVSFISATYIIPALYEILADSSDFICLIKPQFEVGRAKLGKGGVVKDEKARLDALNKVTSFAETCGFSTVKTVVSDIIGGDGNIEYLAHFKKQIIKG